MTINPTIPYWAPRSPTGTDQACLAALGNHRQRAILHTLLQYGRSLSRADLVERLLARAGKPSGSRAAVESSLTHVDLPRLAAARLVATSEESTVRLLEHPLLADPHIEQFLALDETWDDRLRLLAVERHRLICAILADHPTGLPRDRLAALVAAHDSPRVTHSADLPAPDTQASNAAPSLSIPIPNPAPAPRAVAAIAEALHHIHLPALDAAGLVVYDPDAGTIVASDVDSAAVRQPTDSSIHRYTVDCPDAGIGIRLVVSPDGLVDDAYAYTVGDSTIRTVGVPMRSATGDDAQSEPPTDGSPEETARREQWLVDCWLRDNVAS